MDKKRPGYALFIDRVRREGRYDEWKRWYDKHKEGGDSIKKATYNACLSMGYAGAKSEREKHEKFVRDESKKEHEEWHNSEIRANQLDEEEIAIVKVLGDFDISESDLPEHIAWVYHNLHKCKGEVNEWFVTPDQAPSPGAWSMLEWAVGNRTKFMDSVIREQLKLNAAKDVDEGMKAVEKSIEQIDEMLRSINREKASEKA